jgi:small-conductance mechanosensitive channel
LKTQWAPAEAAMAWFSENVLTSMGVGQLVLIGGAYLLARLTAGSLRRFFEKRVKDSDKHAEKLLIRPLSILFGYTLWALLLWFGQSLCKKLGLPSDIFRVATDLALGLMLVHVATSLIRKRIWAGSILAVGLSGILLRIFNLWDPTVQLLDGMKADLGVVSFSVFGLIRFIFVFAVLWSAVVIANRYFGHWLTGAKNLSVSDQILISRVFKSVMFLMIVLFSLNAAGIHVAALAITGGAIGVAIGVGLQRIGSNLVSGLYLLISKPVRPGDVIALSGGISGSLYGTITQMSLTYVRVATRDGTEQLIPNEQFMLNKVENLSYSSNLFKIRIPIGVSYQSNVEKARTLAEAAAMSIGRVMKSPGPKCRLKGFGDSCVDFVLQAWINDPQNGIGNVKDAVLSAVWESFREGGIEIPFPQRELHLKNPVAMKIVDGNPNSHGSEKESIVT